MTEDKLSLLCSTKVCDQLDQSSFELGKHVGEIKAWCEAARNGAKRMSLSAPFRPSYYRILLPHMELAAKQNGVHYLLEKELHPTDLFGSIDLSGLWVFLICQDEKVVDDYRILKGEIEALNKAGQYVGSKRLGIAYRFGRLLGYSDVALNTRLSDRKGSEGGCA